MSRVIKHLPLWSGAALVAVIDAVLCIQIVQLIGYSQNARSGSGRMWAETKIGLIALASISVAFWAVRSYLGARLEMGPPARSLARMPLICLGGLLLAYFVVLPLLSYLYA